MSVLTREILFGLNSVTLVGSVPMGVVVTQSAQGRARAPVAFALMGVGTVLVFAGIYFGQHPL